MLVVDASALVELLLGKRSGSIAGEVDAQDLHAPALIDVEVLSAVRRLRVPARRGDEAVEDLLSLRLRRHPPRPFVQRIWELRENFTPYDAAYVALAEALAAPLLTTDAKLARATRRHTDVEPLLVA